jgi:ribosomal-protein-alanine N-acetyltransferase
MTTRNFTPFPVLTTKRLTLRQLSIDDKEGIFELRSDAEINKYLDRDPSKTVDDAVKFIARINESIQNNNSLYWVISLAETKEFAGTICLFDFSAENNSCEIGYELITKFQGQGIMQEAIKAVIDYAFRTLSIRKIVACTHSENERSTKLLLKFNFVKSLEQDVENPHLNCYTLRIR